MQVTKHPGKVYRYKLGLMGHDYTEYDWAAIRRVAAKETSDNRLRLEVQLLTWAADGHQLDPQYFEPESVKSALVAAKAHVAAGGSMAEVRGIASRLFGICRSGDRVCIDLYTVEGT